MEIQPDHVQLFLTIPPAIAVADAVKTLKGATARRLFVQFPGLRQKLRTGHLWSRSFYVGAVGNVSAETIRTYIERSKKAKLSLTKRTAAILVAADVTPDQLSAMLARITAAWLLRDAESHWSVLVHDAYLRQNIEKA